MVAPDAGKVRLDAEPGLDVADAIDNEAEVILLSPAEGAEIDAELDGVVGAALVRDEHDAVDLVVLDQEPLEPLDGLDVLVDVRRPVEHARGPARGDKAVEWARSAVTNARAATAQEALSLGVVDAVAEDVPDLLQQLNGFEVEVNGELRPLALAGANVIELPMTSPENTLNTLINAIAVPGIAVLLIVLGVQGIISEFSQPGGYMAGTAGFVALLLGMYALGILNANWVGLGFMLLSFILFFLEIKAPTHGALTVAGVVTFVFGAYVLFSGTEAGVPWAAILGLAGATLLFFTFIVAKAIGAQRLKPAWGAESLIGQLAFVRTELNPSGTVVVQGERWQAELQDGSATVQPGARVVVVERHGFKLLVRPDSSSPASP